MPLMLYMVTMLMWIRHFSHARVFQPCTCISTMYVYFTQSQVFQPRTCISAMHRYSPMYRYFTHAQVFQQCTGISSIHVYFIRARVFHPCMSILEPWNGWMYTCTISCVMWSYLLKKTNEHSFVYHTCYINSHATVQMNGSVFREDIVYEHWPESREFITIGLWNRWIRLSCHYMYNRV